jgi:hypothetical protein
MKLSPEGRTCEHRIGLSRRELVKYGTVAAVAAVVQPDVIAVWKPSFRITAIFSRRPVKQL